MNMIIFDGNISSVPGLCLCRAMIVPLVIASRRKLKESKTKDPPPY
jgi:hypothetical protein